MSDIENLTKQLLKFRDDRNWGQFHNAKDLAIAINIESSELLELFLWKAEDQANLEGLKDELADIFSFALLLAEKYKLDVAKIVSDKIRRNALKYPIEKSKGVSTKYTDL